MHIEWIFTFAILAYLVITVIDLKSVVKQQNEKSTTQDQQIEALKAKLSQYVTIEQLKRTITPASFKAGWNRLKPKS